METDPKREIEMSLNRMNAGSLLSAVLTAWLFAGCASFRHAGDPWLGRDKVQHFVACGLAGAAAALVAQNNDGSDGQTFLIGTGVAVGLGAGKETYDAGIQRTYFSGKDWVWDLLGGAAGSLVVLGAEE